MCCKHCIFRYLHILPNINGNLLFAFSKESRKDNLLICEIISSQSAWPSIALSDGWTNVPVSRVIGGGQDGK